MSTRVEHLSQHHPTTLEEHTSAGSPTRLRGPNSASSASALDPLDECIGAISLIQVTVHSLGSQDIAAPEQEVLKRALQALWSVHNWIYDRSWPDTAAQSDSGQECRP
jgi:hypothetical protein